MLGFVTLHRPAFPAIHLSPSNTLLEKLHRGEDGREVVFRPKTDLSPFKRVTTILRGQYLRPTTPS